MNRTQPRVNQFFTLSYSASIRIWHWLTFLLLSASMVTVLFAETVFDEEESRPPVRTEQATTAPAVQPARPQLSPERQAARKYRHKIWEAHKIIGFCLCFLLLSRVIIEVRRNKTERLIPRINKALSIRVTDEEAREEKLHYLLSKGGYVFFYGLLLLMSITGLILAFEDVAFLKTIRRPSKEVHEILQYLMYAYVLAHLVGVVRADLKNQKGIVSAMINGGNQ